WVVNPLEPRLRDVVPIPEVNAVVFEAAALAYTEQCQGSFAGERALLDFVELLDFLGVDRCDEMDPLGLVEGLWPGLLRARPYIPGVKGAGGHPLDEPVREHFKRRVEGAEGAQPLVGQADVETGVRLGCPPIPRRDLRNIPAAAGSRGGEP